MGSRIDVVADIGPRNQFGGASIALAEALGVKNCSAKTGGGLSHNARNAEPRASGRGTPGHYPSENTGNRCAGCKR